MGLRSLLGLVFCTLALAATDSPEWGDSGIIGPRYSEILAAMDRVAAANPDLVEVLDYGKSVQGRTLRMLIVARRDTKPKERNTMLMTGSTHGNEYLNIEDRLPEHLLNKAKKPGAIARYLDSGGAFVFVPILNPDGYDNRTRENANGVDLNRDWDVPPAGFQGFTQQETRLLATTLDLLKRSQRRLEYRVTVDYHCCIGALLHPLSYKKEKLPEADAHKHARVSDIAHKELGIEVGTTGEILGYYPVGTTKDYYYTKYGAAAFTYEGKYKAENQYFDRHIAWWEGMAASIAEEHSAALVVSLVKKRHPFLAIAD